MHNNPKQTTLINQQTMYYKLTRVINKTCHTTGACGQYSYEWFVGYLTQTSWPTLRKDQMSVCPCINKTRNTIH